MSSTLSDDLWRDYSCRHMLPAACCLCVSAWRTAWFRRCRPRPPRCTAALLLPSSAGSSAAEESPRPAGAPSPSRRYAAAGTEHTHTGQGKFLLTYDSKHNAVHCVCGFPTCRFSSIILSRAWMKSSSSAQATCFSPPPRIVTSFTHRRQINMTALTNL